MDLDHRHLEFEHEGSKYGKKENKMIVNDDEEMKMKMKM